MAERVVADADQIYCWLGPRMKVTVFSATLGRLLLTDQRLVFSSLRAELSIALASITKCEGGRRRALVVTQRDADGVAQSHAFGQRMGMPARERWIQLINDGRQGSEPTRIARGSQSGAQHTWDDPVGRAAFDISPHWADGYVFGDSAFVHVSETPAGPIVIESGSTVRLAPGDPAEHWLVRGRSDGLKIAVDGPNHKSVVGLDLRSFLIANPSYLDGQLVRHDGATWQVATRDRERPALRHGDEERPVGIEDLLDVHLETFRSRAVLIVDKG